MDLADDRRDVMFAMRLEADVLQRDDLVVAVGLLEGSLQQCDRILLVAAEELLVGANDPVRCAVQPLALRIVTGPADQGADRFLGLLPGWPPDGGCDPGARLRHSKRRSNDLLRSCSPKIGGAAPGRGLRRSQVSRTC